LIQSRLNYRVSEAVLKPTERLIINPRDAPQGKFHFHSSAHLLHQRQCPTGNVIVSSQKSKSCLDARSMNDWYRPNQKLVHRRKEIMSIIATTLLVAAGLWADA
jgi:hypothetical protein